MGRVWGIGTDTDKRGNIAGRLEFKKNSVDSDEALYATGSDNGSLNSLVYREDDEYCI